MYLVQSTDLPRGGKAWVPQENHDVSHQMEFCAAVDDIHKSVHQKEQAA
jgi:hypothetical protein